MIGLGLGLGLGRSQTGSGTPTPTGAGPFVFPATITKPATVRYAATTLAEDPTAAPPYGNDANDGLTAATPWTLVKALSQTPDGGRVELLDGWYTPYAPDLSSAQVGHRPWGASNKTLTIHARNRGNYDINPLGDGGTCEHRFQRKVVIDALWRYDTNINIIWLGIAFTTKNCLTNWPRPGDPYYEAWGHVGLGTGELTVSTQNAPIHYTANGSTLRFWGCEGYTGYGPSQLPYDVATTYDEMKSPTWWNDFDYGITANGELPGKVKRYKQVAAGSSGAKPGWGYDGEGNYSPYPVMVLGPSFQSGYTYGLILEECYLHDMSCMLLPNVSGTGGIYRVWNTEFARTYGDFITSGISSFNYQYFSVRGCIFRDCLGHTKDIYGPHNDIHQLFTTDTSGTITAPARMRNIDWSNNIYFYSHGCRGKPQTGFFQSVSQLSAGQKGAEIGVKWRNLLIVGAYKTVWQTPGRDSYVRNVLAYNPIGFVSAQNTEPSEIHIDRYGYYNGIAIDAGASRSIAINSLFEKNGNTSDVLMRGCLVPGYQNVGSYLTNPNDSAAFSTAHAWYEASKGLSGFTQIGPQYANVRAMLADKVFTGEEPWVGFTDSLQQEPSTQITSNLAVIHGGEIGDTIALTGFPTTGGWEWRQLSGSDETTVVDNWNSSATGTLVVNNVMQLRQTTPATYSTPQSVSFQVGGKPMTWLLSTRSNNTFPNVTMPSSSGFHIANSTSAGVASSQTLWFYYRGKPAASQTGLSVSLAKGGTGSNMFGGINISTTNKLNFSIRDSGGVCAASGVTTATVTRDGNTLVEWLFSIDMTQPTWGEGIKAYQRTNSGSWSNIMGSTPSNFTQNAFINLSSFSGLNFIRFLENYEGTLEAIAMGVELIDITDPSVRDLFTADNIGQYAKGPTGGIRPLFFFVGQKTLLDASNANQGTWPQNAGKIAGTITAGTPQTWPVPLDTIIFPATYTGAVGVPMTLLVKPMGYISPGASVTMSAASGTFDNNTKSIPEGYAGVSFTYTPTSTGSIVISGSTTGGHTSPPSVTIVVS